MWVQTGYSTLSWNGEWRPSARLIKVDTASVTREWTADGKYPVYYMGVGNAPTLLLNTPEVK